MGGGNIGSMAVRPAELHLAHGLTGYLHQADQPPAKQSRDHLELNTALLAFVPATVIAAIISSSVVIATIIISATVITHVLAFVVGSVIHAVVVI